ENVSSDRNVLLAPIPPISGKTTTGQQKQRRFLSGWRIGALASLTGATSVLLLNVIVYVWVTKNPGLIKSDDLIGTLLQGSYEKVRRLNIWVHLLVNILSTLLLCGSNYCMQVFIAPNRSDLDHAHAKRIWLHIGEIPSLHNLAHIAPKCSQLWVLLMLSSLPIHLLFNSIIFTNLQANSYVVIPTDEHWLNGGSYDFTNFDGFEPDKLTSLGHLLDQYRPIFTDTITLRDNTTVPRYKNISTSA
ncbi:hypothetical protein T440DRAFT_530336, partial [Plenodomus tracheiphilus IPT5]